MSHRVSHDDVVEQHLQVRVDRVVTRELLVEVPGEHLDVAGLVHHLRRRVVLRVDPRHGLDDLRGADQRALLAVEELRERPVLALDAELDPLVVGPRLERRALEVEPTRERAVDVRLPRSRAPARPGRPASRPVEVGGRVPLRRLRLLVQLDERLARLLVVPREQRVGVRPGSMCWTSSTSLLVIERIASRSSMLVAADHLLVRCHGITPCWTGTR